MGETTDAATRRPDAVPGPDRGAPAAGRPTVVVVGLGPAGPELLSEATRSALGGPTVFLRTRRHPAARAISGAESFDDRYEEGSDFDDIYHRIVDDLVTAARQAAGRGEGAVVYAVPGSPVVAERTVELLRHDARIEVEIRPALSFLDLAWARLGIDPLRDGVRLVDGPRFSVQAAGERGPLLVAQCWSADVLSAIKLSVDAAVEDPAATVTLLHHLGLPDEQVLEVRWWEMDRSLEPDHLTSLWIPTLTAPVAGELSALLELVQTLRLRCPWDQRQTHASLARHLLEETYEVLEAIDELPAPGDQGAELGLSEPVAHLCEELGDLLVQVYFHSVLAAEEGRFTLADVARSVRTKLVARHPHVFGDVVAESPEAVAANWENLKQAEKGRRSITEGIPAALPALAFARKLAGKADQAGMVPRPPAELASGIARAVGALVEGAEGDEADQASGRALLALVELSRVAGADAEEALRRRALELRDAIVAHEDLAGPT